MGSETSLKIFKCAFYASFHVDPVDVFVCQQPCLFYSHMIHDLQQFHQLSQFHLCMADTSVASSFYIQLSLMASYTIHILITCLGAHHIWLLT